MGFNKLYTDEQWSELQLAIGHVFLMVADADGVIDKKEIAAMDRIINCAGKLDMRFPDELLTSIKDAGRDILFDAKEYKYSSEDLLKVVSTTAKVAGIDEANQYKKFLLAAGLYIGMASGKFLQKKLSNEEYDRIDKIGQLINFDCRAVVETGIADKIISCFDANIKKR
jgi:hypothetical protein